MDAPPPKWGDWIHHWKRGGKERRARREAWVKVKASTASRHFFPL